MSNYKLRDYQETAITTLFDWFHRNSTGHPIVSACVGAGKSILIAEFCKRVITQYSNQRILMVVSSKELVQQNYDKLRAIYPEAKCGLYSAGLGKKNPHAQIVFATICSIYDKCMQTGGFNVCVIDECHTVSSKKDTGMYRKMIADYTRLNPNFRVIGFTGTPFRGNGILLTEGKEALFTDIATEVGMTELLEQDYLSPLVVRQTDARIDVSNVHVSKMTGDYNISELASAADKSEITRAAVSEIVREGQDRKAWLVYGVTIEHCEHIHAELEKYDLNGAVLHSKTPKAQRDRIVSQFKAGRLRYIVNVSCLSVGFDCPEVDLIALLRPTASPVLYVQVSGRGMRLADGKENCLWLDFTNTTETLGAVDQIRGKKEPKKKGEAPMKKCPSCEAMLHASAAFCECGQEFEISEADRLKNLRKKASDAQILSINQAPLYFTVIDWKCAVHRKLGSQDTMRVDYYSSDIQGGNLLSVTTNKQSEWLCFDHEGFAKRKAEQWWVKMGGNVPTPKNVEQAMARFSELRKPALIELKKNGKYNEVKGHVWTEPVTTIEQQPAALLPNSSAERSANPVARNLLADIAANKARHAMS